MYFRFIGFSLLMALSSGCASNNQITGQPWQSHTSAAEAGFNQEKLEEVSALLENLDTTALMVIQNGKVAYQYGDLDSIGYLASVRKSVLSILYGKYVENGTIDLGQSIGSLNIDDTLGLLPIEKTATIDHLITARSGVFHPAANSGYDQRFADIRGTKTPGEFFVYNNWDFNVAGFVFEKYAKQSIYQELEQQLAIPLGFEDWDLDRQKKKYNDNKSIYPAYHIYLSTRDLAKIGQLMLQRGKWNAEQLISESWIDKITTPVTTIDEVKRRYGDREPHHPNYSYSYMWWNFDEFKGDKQYKGSYSATGWGGQYITVIPELDMVIAHKTTLSFLVRWGLINGGVSENQYYKIVDKIVNAKNAFYRQ